MGCLYGISSETHPIAEKENSALRERVMIALSRRTVASVFSPNLCNVVLRPREPASKDRATNRHGVGFRLFKVALKDDYKGA